MGKRYRLLREIPTKSGLKFASSYLGHIVIMLKNVLLSYETKIEHFGHNAKCHLRRNPQTAQQPERITPPP